MVIMPFFFWSENWSDNNRSGARAIELCSRAGDNQDRKRLPVLGADKFQKLSDKVFALETVKNVTELRPLLQVGKFWTLLRRYRVMIAP
jgi:hypothetical protein